jgi:hypothetical protein
MVKERPFGVVGMGSIRGVPSVSGWRAAIAHVPFDGIIDLPGASSGNRKKSSRP